MEENQDLIEGRNSVIELLKSGKDINKLYIQKGERHGSITEILKLAKQSKVIIQEVDKIKLDKMSETHNHQGVIAIVPPYEYCDVDDILKDGLKPQNRLHVHLSSTIETALNVGKRHGVPIVFKIDSQRMFNDGAKFYLSRNGVWLTDYVATEYLSLEK